MHDSNKQTKQVWIRVWRNDGTWCGGDDERLVSGEDSQRKRAELLDKAEAIFNDIWVAKYTHLCWLGHLWNVYVKAG